MRFCVSQGLSDIPSFKGTAGLQVVFRGIWGQCAISVRDGGSTEPAIGIAGTAGAFERGMGGIVFWGKGPPAKIRELNDFCRETHGAQTLSIKGGNSLNSPFPTEAATHSEGADVGEGVRSAQRWDRLAGRSRSKPRKMIHDGE